MLMPGRKYSSDKYRYGFNGKENDNEVKGDGNQQDYGMRVYDLRLGKFLSIDPLFEKRVWLTPYNFVSNEPLTRIDPNGALDGEYEITHDKDGKEIKTKISDLGDDVGIDFNHHLDGNQAGNTEIVNNKTGVKNWITDGVKFIRGYERRNNKTTWETIFDEWKSERGPTNSLIFGRDQPMNKAIRTSNLYAEARNDYLEKQAWDFDGKIHKVKEIISFAKWLPGLKAVILSGDNMTMQMLGTVNVSFYNIGNYQRLVLINDSKSVESFNRIGIKLSRFLEKTPSRITRQTYIWIDNNVEE